MDLTEFEEYNEKVETEANLFRRIFLAPREAFKFIVKYKYDKYVPLLLVLAGISRAFDRAAAKNMGDTSSLIGIIIGCILLGGLLGWLGFYIYAAALSVTGRLLKGAGNTQTILPILAYASLPVILALPLLIPQIAVYGAETFKAEGDITSAGMLGNIIYYTSLLAEFIFGIWTLVLVVIGISEVQQFSIGKAILNVLLPLLVIIVPVALLFLLTSSFS